MAAIFNNCGTTVTFRVGATDSQFYESVYYDRDTNVGFKANDLANLGLGEVIMRVMTTSGIQSNPFIAKTFPPVPHNPKANPELIRKRSRNMISKPRDQIRKTIEERMALDTMNDAQS